MQWTKPRQITEASPGAQSYARGISAVMAAKGTPPLPWQKEALRIGTQLDSTGRLQFQTVIVTVPRQCGKSTMSGGLAIHRCLMSKSAPANVWYTAQTGQDASEWWADHLKSAQRAAFIRDYIDKVSLSKGSQFLRFSDQSLLRPHPPKPEALHGKQSDLNIVDEAWAFDVLDGAALIQQIVPTYTTREKIVGIRPQLWILSTEGTQESTWFNALLDQARAGDDSICLIDYGIGDDVEPDDLEAVARAHPGYPHLLDMRSLHEFRSQFSTWEEFARAYGNRRLAGAETRAISPNAWERSTTTDTIPDTATVTFGAAVGIDGEDSAIVAHAMLGETHLVEVVDYKPGYAWLADRLDDLARNHRAIVAIDSVGPSAPVYADLKRRGTPVEKASMSTITAGTALVLTGVTAKTVTWRHRPHPALDQAASNATLRHVGDGGRAFARKQSIGSIAALEAATVATATANAAEAPLPQPIIIGG
ncbi:hypothetical protein QP572_02300 [Brevibacterium sp. UMB10442]|nr:hypothetical protein [Brevibacterium sp. UMB10442]